MANWSSLVLCKTLLLFYFTDLLIFIPIINSHPCLAWETLLMFSMYLFNVHIFSKYFDFRHPKRSLVPHLSPPTSPRPPLIFFVTID